MTVMPQAEGTPSRAQERSGLFARVALPTWLFSLLVLCAVSWRRILEMRFQDPDDLLRMVEVRDWLHGQGWFDVTQYRMNVPKGAPMHWSRLVDLPIAFFIEILRPLVGMDMAEMLAAAIVPLLTLLVLLSILARLVDGLLGRRAAFFACLMVPITLSVILQFQVYRVDHHAWQMVCAAAMMLGVFLPAARRGGALAGISGAIWLTISLEGLPMVVGTLTALGLGCLLQRKGDRDGTRLESAALALALTTTILWFTTRLPQGLEVWCDAVSAYHLATFGAAALGIWLTRRFAQGPLGRFAGLAISGFVCALLLAIPAPQCVTGAFNDLPPLVHRYWYEKIAEGLPIWRQDWNRIVTMVALLPISVWGLVLLGRSRREARGDWAMYGGLLGLAVAISWLVARADGVAMILAIVPASHVVDRLLARARTLAIAPLRILATTAAILLPFGPLLLLNGLVPSDAPREATRKRTAEREDDCLAPTRLRALGKVLESRKTGPDIMAPLDLGPALLFSTDATVLASSHHRNKVAMNDVIRFWMAPPAQAHAILEARGSDFVLFCPGISETRTFAQAAPEGMMARLSRGEVPDWLIPLHDGRLGALKVYRVR